MESRLSTNEKPSDSEIAVKTQALVGEKCESSHLDEPQSSLFSVSANDQIPQNKMSLRNEASVEEICGSSPSANAQLLPQHSSENELSPECVGSRALMEKDCKNSPLDNVGLGPFPVSGSVNEKIQENATSIRVKSSSEKNCNSSNLQSVLVCDSTLCLRSDDVGCHVRDSIEKNSKEEVPPTVSAPTKSTEKGERRTSKYHGVTRHFWTGKFEAHLWDNSFIQEGHRRKGKQVFLGQYEIEEKAAQAYDVAALKYWGTGASPKLNFPITMYKKELEEMKNMSRDEFVLCIKRKSCFKRGSSIYRGVTRHGDGRWQARISGVPCKKGLHLGTFSSEEEAAKAYDIAAVKLRGKTAFTNFDITNYCQGALEESEGQSQPKRLKNSKAAASTTIDLELYPQTDVPVISP